MARVIASAVASKPKRRKIPQVGKEQKQMARAQRPLKMLMKRVSAPVVRGNNVRIGAASINGGKSFIVKHTEYLQDLTALADWDISSINQVYILQPGLASEFPWLAPIAANFEQYRWRKLIFHYKARAPTTQGGALYMGTQLNVEDANFSDKASMFNYVGTTINELWTNYSHNCLLRRGDYLKKYFVRVGDLAPGQDQLMYDQGKFTYVPVSGSQVVVGELLVEYEIEFFNPKSNPNGVTDYAYYLEGNYNASTAFPSNVVVCNSSAGGGVPIVWSNAPAGAQLSYGAFGGYPEARVDLAGGNSVLAVFNAYQATAVALVPTLQITYMTDRAGTVPLAYWEAGTGTNAGATIANGSSVAYAFMNARYWFAGEVNLTYELTSTVSFATHTVNIVAQFQLFSTEWWNASGATGPMSSDPRYKRRGKNQPLTRLLDLTRGPVVERCGTGFVIFKHKSHQFDTQQLVSTLLKEEKERKVSLPLEVPVTDHHVENSDSEPEVVQLDPKEKKSKRTGFKHRKDAD